MLLKRDIVLALSAINDGRRGFPATTAALSTADEGRTAKG